MRRKHKKKEASRIIIKFCILSFELCKVDDVREQRQEKCKLDKSPKCAKFNFSDSRLRFLVIAIRHDLLFVVNCKVRSRKCVVPAGIIE